MKIYNAAIIGLGPSGLAVNKLIFNNINDEIIAFESSDIEKRNNYFGFWLTEWMKPFDELIEKNGLTGLLPQNKKKLYIMITIILTVS